MKISQGSVRGEPCWVLNYKVGKKYCRRYFPTKGAALVEMERLNLEHRNLGNVFSAVPMEKRVELVTIDKRMTDAGATLRDAVDFYFAHRPSATPPTLAEAREQAVAESRATDSKKFADSYAAVLRLLVAGCEAKRVADVKHEHVFALLNNPDWKASSRNTAFTRLQKFFTYCEQRGWLALNPMGAIKKFKESDKAAPSIFTTAQAACLLHAAQRTNAALGMLPYFTLGLFCGLRPENELRLMAWENVHADEAFVAVDAATSKGERHRNVTLPQCAAEFLKLGGHLPAGSISHIKRMRREVVDEANALAKARKVPRIVWAQDVMRHTFASHHYNQPGGTAEATKREMGHSRASQQLFEHYQARVRPAEAVAFWKIAPESV